jgi:exopolysaccharide biosynthesis WecB/TagA/CpsF family protein
MENSFFELLGIKIARCTEEEAFVRLKEKKPSRLFFANPHAIMCARKNENFLAAFQQAELVLNDGVGIDIAAWMLRQPLFPCDLKGADFIPKLLSREQGGLFLIGPSRELLEKAAPIFGKQFPSTPLLGMCDGYTEEAETILRVIEEAKPEILLVTMGMPVQELFITENWPRLVRSGVRLAIGGGAVIDFIAGKIPRAPKWMRRAHIEWLYRLIREPTRLAHRYLVEAPAYIFFIIKEALHRHG